MTLRISGYGGWNGVELRLRPHSIVKARVFDLRRVGDVAAVRVVVGAAGRRVETHRLLHFVLASAHEGDRAAHATRQANGLPFIVRVDVLAIVVVMDTAALAVERGIRRSSSCGSSDWFSSVPQL